MPTRPFHRPLPAAIALTLAGVLTFAGSSRADSAAETARTSTDPDGYTYRFKDDPLRAGGLGPNDARLRVVAHAARSLLIRPRTQFVAEMLKSVEDL